MQNAHNTRAKAAGLAQCGVIMIFFAGFFALVGSVITGIGHSNEEPFFESIHRPMRIAGPVLISVGLVMVITAVVLICYSKQKMKENFRSGQHSTGVSGPMITGSAPANTYMGAQGPGAQLVVHPTTNVGYTPQQAGLNNQPVYPQAPYAPNTTGQSVYPPAKYPEAMPIVAATTPPPTYDDAMEKQ